MLHFTSPHLSRIVCLLGALLLLVSAALAQTCVPNIFTNKTTANGLGDNVVRGVFAVGSTVYAATAGGLSISTDGLHQQDDRQRTGQ